ncbi:hypothetical protein T12_7178, partial [Trichinella patagoniensis]
LEFPAKRQSCGWNFRYRHPDIAGNWLAHVFTDNTNPLKIKKQQNWTVPGILYHAQKRKKMRIWINGVTVHRRNSSNARRRNDECTKSEFSPCHLKSSQHRKGL